MKLGDGEGLGKTSLWKLTSNRTSQQHKASPTQHKELFWRRDVSAEFLHESDVDLYKTSVNT